LEARRRLTHAASHAQDFTGAPLAVIELPVRVPFGSHGGWISDEA
jgi:carotenoid cleavage dioxygenase-like enzyme